MLVEILGKLAACPCEELALESTNASIRQSKGIGAEIVNPGGFLRSRIKGIAEKRGLSVPSNAEAARINRNTEKGVA